MKKTSGFLLALPLFAVLLTGCPEPQPFDPPKEISAKEANAYVNAFASRTAPSFAKHYKVDVGVLSRMGDQAHGLYVAHGLNDSRERVTVLKPVDREGLVVEDGPVFIQSPTNLCPPRCDAEFAPATEIERVLAGHYIDNFRRSQIDEVSAFVITADVISGLGGTGSGTPYLRVDNGLSGEQRILVIRSGATDPNTQSVQTIYLQNQTTLCPPRCDFERETGAGDR
jgi:hypothetical protein